MMRPFSRWMPKPDTPGVSAVGWLIVAFVLPIFILLLAVTWPLMLFGRFFLNRHFRRLLSERPGEDIGTFARAFDRRTQPFDPWVVRAVWDALVPYVVCGGRKVPVPLRPSDRLFEDLRIDPEDTEFELIEEIATRSRHSLNNLENNPFFGEMETVGDLIHFISLQPRVRDPGTMRRDARPA
jgi:hypothetical protein